MRSYGRALLILCVTVSALTIPVGGASAGVFPVSSCDASTRDGRSFGGDWQAGGIGAVDRPVLDCPNGNIFDTQGPAIFGDMWAVWFNQYTESILQSSQFTYYGGDTSGAYNYTVRTCHELDCPVIAELEPGGSATEPRSIDFGFGTRQISNYAIVADCAEAICPDPPPFVSKNFLHVYKDEASPQITDVQVTPAGATGVDANWLGGGELKVSIVAEDAGSGITAVFMGVDGTLGESSLISCDGGDGTEICSHYVSVSKVFKISEITEGEHFIRVVIYDKAVTFPDFVDLPFRVDKTPPDEPTGLDLTPGVTPAGWTTSPVISVAHDDPLASENNTDASGWDSAIFDLRKTPNSIPVDSFESDDPYATAEFTFPEEGTWDVGVRYRDGAGNLSNRAHRFVGYDIDSPEKPDADPLGWISLAALYSGVDQEWSPPPEDPELESGICGYSFTVDDDPEGIPPAKANVPADSNSAQVPMGVGEGNHYAHVRTVACNGNASVDVETEDVKVDGTAPDPVLHGLDGDAWLTSPPNVSISSNESGSGTTSIEYGFDGLTSLQPHPGSVVALSVPQGESTLVYRATDAVNNVSVLKERKVKADWTPPSVEFESDDFGRPNAVTARITDDESGLTSAAMQIHRIDSGASPAESAWHTIGESSSAAPEGTGSMNLTRLVPDGDLADGTYELRVAARDVAGNWSEEFPTKQLTLPLRGQSSLSAAIATYGKGSRVNWSGAKQDRLIRYGTRAALVGSLLDSAGNPIANARLTVKELPEFGVERDFGETTTNGDGEFVMKLPIGATRTFTVSFDGAARARPATETATIRSRAALTFSIDRRTVRSGKPFVVRGRLLSASLGTPEGGKIVSIEYLQKRTWMSWVDRRVDSKGRFTYRSPGLSKDRPTTIYFHVKAKREGNWPFVTGSSKTVALRLLPSRK